MDHGQWSMAGECLVLFAFRAIHALKGHYLTAMGIVDRYGVTNIYHKRNERLCRNMV